MNQPVVAQILIEMLADGSVRASWQNATPVIALGMMEQAKLELHDYHKKQSETAKPTIVVPEMQLVPKNGR